MATAVEFISILHQSKTQAQVWHHQTTSYSEHKALGSYYEGITELIDELVESLQGYTPRITVYTNKTLVDMVERQSDIPKIIMWVRTSGEIECRRLLLGTKPDRRNTTITIYYKI